MSGRRNICEKIEKVAGACYRPVASCDSPSGFAVSHRAAFGNLGTRQMIEEKYSFFNVDIAMHYFLAPLISGIATILILLLSILSVIGKVEQRKKGLWEGICLFLATAGAGFTWILAGTPLTGVVTGLLLCTIMAYIACIKNLGNCG